MMDIAFVPFGILGGAPTWPKLQSTKDCWPLALVTVCDSPDLEAFPLPPGRSGFEFILQMLALENTELYS